LPEILEFEAFEQTQITGPRVYINSTSQIYKIIRELSLPNITYISIIKLIDEGQKIFYYFRLFADYFGEVEHPYTLKKEQKQVSKAKINSSEKMQICKARIGQGEYRKKLLEICPFCPITLVSDERILIASHIKP
jgi:hypothetical protein